MLDLQQHPVQTAITLNNWNENDQVRTFSKTSILLIMCQAQ